MAIEAEALKALMTQQVMGEMPDYLKAAKRVNVESSDWMDDWYVGFGKDESCQIEGTANHWNWLALLILGLADPKDRPYDEDKSLPINPAALRAVWEGFVNGSLIHRSALAEDTARAVEGQIPEGWEPVPVEPTRAMRDEVSKAVDDFSREGAARLFAADLYRAMLAAAPALPLTKEADDANR